LIPDILAAFERGDPVAIRNPNSTRPWQHVLEPLRGYLMLAERLFVDGPKFAEGWNFGPNDDDAKPVGWLVQQMAELNGSGAQWEPDAAYQPHEAQYLKLDISKARSLLNWQPALCLRTALQLIMEWTREYGKGADMHAFTISQIRNYQELTQT
jgi:CDP-glucose 4,6-dehydratase